MKILAIQSSNRTDGLTAQLAQSVLNGALAASENSIETELIHLNQRQINVCMACGGAGWGGCRHGEPCVQKDDFTSLHVRIISADALVFATPVYFWDLSESAKTFLDRLRRAEWPLRDKGRLRGKPVVGIAAAGGSGNGAPSAIRNLESYMTYIGMRHIAYLPVSRQNRRVQLLAAENIGAHLVHILRD